ncbi:MAG: calcium/proton exchanger [Bacillota bacterium]|nr:calcium/proton exchanger [Bacillota bacterium]
MSKKTILLLPAVLFIFYSFRNSAVNLVVYSICIVPLAYVLGEFTSEMSLYIGEKKGGLLAATLGNLPELAMGVWSMRYGMVLMTKSALIGSIISNMLLVLGISIFIGGVKYRQQSFNKIVARTNFNMLLLALSVIVLLASLKSYSSVPGDRLLKVSVIAALLMLSIYILGLIFSLHTHSNLFIVSEVRDEISSNNRKAKQKVGVKILIISVILFIISERLIQNINIVVEKYNVSQEFIGIILIPILGNIGENLSAIISATRNKVNLSLEIAIGSSIQISLFVAPVIIILSNIFGYNMDFIFTGFQIIICAVAVAMSYFVFQDGKTYWLEGAILITAYILISVCYYYMV